MIRDSALHWAIVLCLSGGFVLFVLLRDIRSLWRNLHRSEWWWIICSYLLLFCGMVLLLGLSGGSSSSFAIKSNRQRLIEVGLPWHFAAVLMALAMLSGGVLLKMVCGSRAARRRLRR